MSLLSWALERLEPSFERLYGERKRTLLGELSGRVLEIGAGTGLNRRYLGPEVEWIALEPEAALRQRILRRHPGVEVLAASAEAIPLPDASVDAVISSLVLCSVRSPRQVLSEVLRVLKPGGCLALLEHVAAPGGTWLAWVQRLVRPVWKVVAHGCHPDRETVRFLLEAGFGRVELDSFRAPLPVVSPHVIGRAWK